MNWLVLRTVRQWMEEVNGFFVLSKVKSYVNILVEFYRNLPMGRKDTIFGVIYQKLLVVWHLLNYEYMFAEPPIHIRYVVLNIVILHLCLPLNYFILNNFVHFLDVSLSTYLYLPLTRLRHILEKV